MREIRHGLRCQWITPAADGLRRGVGRGSNDGWRTVDRKIDSRRHGARSDHSHDADERFHKHGSIADQSRVTFAKNHFWRGTRGNQRMKSADGAAGNGNEAKRKNFSGKDWTVAIDKSG